MKLLWIYAAGILVLSLAFIACDYQDKSRVKPNVLFISVDDLNDWVGVLGGHEGTLTPNIDRLASQGTLFTNAYCPAPACNPSRAAMMTGIRPSTSGVYRNDQRWRNSPVLAHAPTIPQYFRQHGYKVMGSGKIFHGRFPDPASWDYYWPSQAKNKPDDPLPADRPVNQIPNTGHFDWGPLQVKDTAMGDWSVASWVIGQLEMEHEKPFFLACGIFRPHLPWYVPSPYFDCYPLDSVQLPAVRQDDLDDIPEAGRAFARISDHRKVLAHEEWHDAVRGYQASISFADACVGRVLNALESSRYRDNTIVVLWSDHGWSLGEKQHWRKFALWEEPIHCVMAIRTPKQKKQGVEVNHPVNLLDIYPTLLSLCNLPSREELEGNDLTPLLGMPDAVWQKPALTTHRRGNHSLRRGKWHYIHYADGSEELYDLDKDPNEWINLAGEPGFEEVVDDLEVWLPEMNAESIPAGR